jgi:hypothetical protein
MQILQNLEQTKKKNTTSGPKHFFLFFVCVVVVVVVLGTQGLTLGRQALYLLNHTPSPAPKHFR